MGRVQRWRGKQREHENVCCLSKHSLIFAFSAIVAHETIACSRGIVANSSSGAIATALISITLQDIRTRWAFKKWAVWTSSAEVAHAANVLGSIPRSAVGAASLNCKLRFSKADTCTTAGVRAHGPLASDSLVILKALAFSSFSITESLVGAFNYGMCIIRVRNGSNPSSISRTCSSRAIRVSPGRGSIDCRITGTFIVGTTCAMATATIRTESGCHSKRRYQDQQSNRHCIIYKLW